MKANVPAGDTAPIMGTAKRAWLSTEPGRYVSRTVCVMCRDEAEPFGDGYQIPARFLITSPAMRSPATGGTKEMLAGTDRFEVSSPVTRDGFMGCSLE